ncbi:hypothetical protein F4778DRAFT_772557 [Xylariomycetidae sp. FL2044]|nr:hypothetical protein F4778DRAFT_772557 [Xylariomycetidae sp. FL2044]
MHASTFFSDLSSAVDPSFAGFGIEPSNLFSFTGQEEPNTLTLNLLRNLKSYRGKPPHIRLGGNTQDNMIYKESQHQWTWIWNPSPTGQGRVKSDSMLIGPRFFEAANRLPRGTPITWGLNLAYEQPDDYIERITTMARLVVEKCTNLRLGSFEIGNEPDLYLQNGFRRGSWGGQVYAQQWLDRASAIFEQVLQPNNLTSQFFETAATASTIGTDFQIHDLMNFDISAPPAQLTQASAAAGFVSSWNQHDYYYYIGVSSGPLTLSRFMQLQTTEDQFAAWAIQVQQAVQTGKPYALREMGLVGPIGMAGVTDVFGAALWTLNFLLYTASLNISSVQLHMTDNSNASAWQPIEMYGRGPHVRPLYYGVAAFDQVLGPTCTARVRACETVQESSLDGYEGFIRAYVVYQGGENAEIASVVAINAKPANVSEADKQSLTVRVKLPKALAGKALHLAYLTGPGADAAKDTVWNGISYEESGDGTPTQVSSDDPTVQVGHDGTVTLTVRDSEAVVANLGGKVGASVIQVNEAACPAAVSSGTPSPSLTGNASPTPENGHEDDSGSGTNCLALTRSSVIVSLVAAIHLVFITLQVF